jgi:hypothetical protein
MSSASDPFDHEFHLLYLAWLQCGADTHIVVEEREREFRQRMRRVEDVCRHGRTRLTCSDCYFHGES